MGATVRLEVESTIPDRHLEKWAQAAREHFGVSLDALSEVKVYKVAANDGAGQDALQSVFVDPVLQRAHFKAADFDFKGQNPAFVVEVSFRAGVTDNPARAAEEALALTGMAATVASGSLYFLFGDVDADGAERVSRELLANDLIQKVDVWAYAAFCALPRFDNVALPKTVLSHSPEPEEISLELEDAELEKMSVDRLLALTLNEMKHIRDHFRALKRNPTDVELEVLAQSWSEHCKHKIFAADIDYTGPDGERQKIQSLYKSYIKNATKEIEQERGLDWLLSVFSDNAGVVRFDDEIDVCIKVETHNSPSALDPYGGALTGILGVNRDILGVGLGARPVANMDVFCLAPPNMPAKEEILFMPEGPKPPRRVLEGVHKGVEDGGNKSGIPTVNGAFFFDNDYAGKPLIFVGTVGTMPAVLPDGRKCAEKQAHPDDRIMMVGGAIGADGIHGATFSSLEMNENAPATAVQIGDPLTQKRVTEFLLEARDLGLYSAITDNGAGGLSSSVGEMATMTDGAEIDLALCTVKYPGLAPWELMISESQERMTVAVPEKDCAAFLALSARHGVVSDNIGKFTDDGMLRILYNKKVVADMSLAFVHDSLPPMQLQAAWTGPKKRKAWSASTQLISRTEDKPETVVEALLKILSTLNVTSKEKWVRAYDHEVQAATHLKPFTGVERDGPSDCGVIALHPHGGSEKGAVAIGCGLAPRLSPFDPYLMAQVSVDEAMRNVVAAGGDPDMCCLLDNFCWPDPVVSAKNPDGAYKMGQLVRTCEGLYDICKVYGAPLVSGKDSMKNDFRGKDKRGEQINISILPTLLVTAMARTELGTVVGSDFKTAGDLVYLLGGNGGGLAGSEFAALFNIEGELPRIDIVANMELYRKIHKTLKTDTLRSVHDVSEGGLLTSVAESAIGGRLGVKLDMALDFDLLFNEAPGRFIVSVAADQQETFEAEFGVKPVGVVIEDKTVTIGTDSLPLDDVIQAWKKGF